MANNPGEFRTCRSRWLPSLEDFLPQFNDFIQSTGLGNTAELCMQYTNHVNLCLRLIKAVKTNLYRYCLIQMCDLFFAYSGQNYARYPTIFSIYVLYVDENHPRAEELLKRGAFSAASHLFLEIDVLLIKKLKKSLWNIPNQEVVVWV